MNNTEYKFHTHFNIIFPLTFIPLKFSLLFNFIDYSPYLLLVFPHACNTSRPPSDVTTLCGEEYQWYNSSLSSSHTLNICLSRTPYNCVVIKSGPCVSELRTTVTPNKCPSLCLQAMAILRTLTAYNQRPEAHQLLCKAIFHFLTEVTWGLNNSALLVNSPRRFEGSCDTPTHPPTHTHTHTHTKRQVNVYFPNTMYEQKYLPRTFRCRYVCKCVLFVQLPNV